jgi:hypothetical protein
MICCKKLEKETNEKDSPFYFWGSWLFCENKYSTIYCEYCPFCGVKLE